MSAVIKSSFKSAWWLKNAHLQTIYPFLFRKTALKSPLHRERLITPDNDFIDIDWLGEAHQPLIVLLHGLTGSSQSTYIRGLQEQFLLEGFRSEAKTAITHPITFRIWRTDIVIF